MEWMVFVDGCKSYTALGLGESMNAHFAYKTDTAPMQFKIVSLAHTLQHMW